MQRCSDNCPALRSLNAPSLPHVLTPTINFQGMSPRRPPRRLLHCARASLPSACCCCECASLNDVGLFVMVVHSGSELGSTQTRCSSKRVASSPPGSSLLKPDVASTRRSKGGPPPLPVVIIHEVLHQAHRPQAPRSSIWSRAPSESAKDLWSSRSTWTEELNEARPRHRGEHLDQDPNHRRSLLRRRRDHHR